MTANQPKKSIKKRIILALAAIVGVVAISVTSVLATVAYLTSSSVVYNVFTIGNVGIKLTESKVDSEGKIITGEGAAQVDTNTYHLVNNKTYDKDPKITVQADSTPSYLFVVLRNDIESIECRHTGEAGHNHKTIAQQLEDFGWMKYKSSSTGWVYLYVGTTTATVDGVEKTVSKVPTGNASAVASNYNFATALANNGTPIVPFEVGSTGEEEVYKLFENFTIDPHLEIKAFGAAKITITAVAIQTDGFGATPNAESVDKAWAAVMQTYPYIHDGSTSTN